MFYLHLSEAPGVCVCHEEAVEVPADLREEEREGVWG